MTLKDVEIVEVGMDWPTSTGMYSFTKQDVDDFVASQGDPSVKPPRFKLGHVSKEGDKLLASLLGDAEPNWGRYENIRLSDNGQVALGDITVPKWLGEILPMLWPSRSIEGSQDWKSPTTGKKYGLHVEAVASLGVMLPAVSSLEDLPLYLGAQMPEGTVIAASAVQASTNIDQIRRQFYAKVQSQEGHTWWWPHEVLIDPNEVIAEDDETGKLYRLTFSTNSQGEITFGEPVEVQTKYEDKVAASAATGIQKVLGRYRNLDDAKLKGESMTIDLEKLRAALKLPAEATEEQILAKATEVGSGGSQVTPEGGPTTKPEGSAPPAPAPKPEPTSPPLPPAPQPAPKPEPEQVAASAPPGTVLVDKTQWEGVQAFMAQQAERDKAAGEQERDREILAAVQAGKIPPSARDNYKKMWDQDKDNAKAILASLAPTLPAGQVLAAAEDLMSDDGTQYPDNWLPAEHRQRVASIRAAQSEGKERPSGVLVTNEQM